MTKSFPDTQNPLRLSVAQHRLIWLGAIPVGTSRLEKNIFFSNTYNPRPGGNNFWLMDLIFRGRDNSKEIAEKLRETNTDIILDMDGVTDRCLKNELSLSEEAGRFTWVEPTYEKMQLDEKTKKFWRKFEMENGTTWLDNYFFYNETSKPSDIQIVPYLVFSFVDKERARLWTVLNVILIDHPNREADWMSNPKKNPDWFCRYLVTVGDPRPLTGVDGWFTKGPGTIERTILKEVKSAVDVMLEDITGKLKDDKAPVEKMSGKWLFYLSPREVDIRVLKRTDNTDVVIPIVGDGEYFAGVNILPKDFAEPLEKKP